MTLALAATVVVTGCNHEKKEPPPAPKARNAAVQGATASAATTPTAVPTPSTPKPKRLLCEGQLEKPGRAVPKTELERAAAPGAAAVPKELPIGGQWTWVNFWAAWCVPCKEEIPRLVSWEKQLNAAGVSFQLTFISLDDDQRQLDHFLRDQPEAGLRSSFWLKDVEERGKWLEQVGVGNDPDLPAHLLIDPQGKLRCVVQGAVEDSDYAQVLRLVSGDAPK